MLSAHLLPSVQKDAAGAASRRASIASHIADRSGKPIDHKAAAVANEAAAQAQDAAGNQKARQTYLQAAVQHNAKAKAKKSK